MKIFALPLVLMLLFLAGCSGSSARRPAPIFVSISPSSAQLGGAESQQFTATVFNATNTAVTWTLLGAGTISASGLYAAPATVTSQDVATVTATSAADPTKIAVATLTLMPPVSVSPSTATVGVTGSQQFTATVTGIADNRVTWSLSGPGCSGITCGSITTAGLYTAPWCVPTPATLTVTATSVADPTKFSTATVTPVKAGSELSGQYAFFFQGTDSDGLTQAAGTLIADGNGHISSGLQDIVRGSGASTNVTFTGAYSSACYCRGTMTLTDSLNRTITFAYALDSRGERARFIELDDSGARGTGLLARQQTSALTLSQTAGDFAFGYSGARNVWQRVGLIGQFSADGAGNITAGSLDLNIDGASSANAPVSGTYTLASTTGRGTAILNAGPPVSRTYHLSYYMISADEAFWVSVESPDAGTPLFGGRVLRQSGGPFTLSSLNAAGVFHLTGKTNGSLDNADVAIGILTSDGGGNITGGPVDENYDTVISNYSTLAGTYALDAGGKGRGTLHLDLGGGGTRDLTIYLVRANTAFLLDGTATVAGPNVGVGFLQPRTDAPYSAASFQGTYYFGTWGMATCSGDLRNRHRRWGRAPRGHRGRVGHFWQLCRCWSLHWQLPGTGERTDHLRSAGVLHDFGQPGSGVRGQRQSAPALGHHDRAVKKLKPSPRPIVRCSNRYNVRSLADAGRNL